MRLLMFPLVIKSQRNVAHMHNHMPTMTRLQEKFTLARQSGNAVEGKKSCYKSCSSLFCGKKCRKSGLPPLCA